MADCEKKLDEDEFINTVERICGIKLESYQKILLKLLLSNSPVGNLIEKNFYKRC